MNDNRKILVGVFGILFLTVGVSLFVGTAGAQSAPDCSTVSYNGGGIDANPYEVENVYQLQCIGSQGFDAHYMQVSDINASGTSSWNNGKGFEPLGEDPPISEGRINYEETFTGTFDGGNHNITGLTINRSNEEYVGLFAFVAGSGKVTNVSIVDADIDGSERVGGIAGENGATIEGSYAAGLVGGSSLVGGLVGHNQGGIIKNSYAAGTVTGSDLVGGLVGENDANSVKGLGIISMSYANVSVNGTDNVGGLVGSNTQEGIIKESHASGSVEGSGTVGGLVGYHHRGTISDSYAAGSVNGYGSVGGLVGENYDPVSDSYATGSVNGSLRAGGLIGKNGDTVEGSYATGSVDGSVWVGGLIGVNWYDTVSNSYATGSVNGSDWVGGLVGENSGNVEQSYATGSVSGSESDVGGLVGWSRGTVEESYWDTQTTGQSTSDGGTGLKTAEMTGEAARGNMTGFDFGNTWRTVPGNYPALKKGEGQGLLQLGFVLLIAALALLTVVAVAVRAEVDVK